MYPWKTTRIQELPDVNNNGGFKIPISPGVSLSGADSFCSRGGSSKTITIRDPSEHYDRPDLKRNPINRKTSDFTEEPSGNVSCRVCIFSTREGWTRCFVNSPTFPSPRNSILTSLRRWPFLFHGRNTVPEPKRHLLLGLVHTYDANANANPSANARKNTCGRDNTNANASANASARNGKFSIPCTCVCICVALVYTHFSLRLHLHLRLYLRCTNSHAFFLAFAFAFAFASHV